MLDRFAIDIIGKINEELKVATAKADLRGGKNAAISIIELMQKCIKFLPPLDIIKAFNESKSTPRNRVRFLFETLNKQTILCMVAGCSRLASIWESAWKEGSGGKISDTKLGKVQNSTLIKLYTDKTFLPAYGLRDPELGEILI